LGAIIHPYLQHPGIYVLSYCLQDLKPIFTFSEISQRLETVEVRSYLAYVFVWVLYQLFKWRQDAFLNLSPEHLQKLSDIAASRDPVISSYFLMLKQEVI
jgi:hypothetical protein